MRNRLEGMIVRACDRSVEWGYKQLSKVGKLVNQSAVSLTPG
ncbi:hypothetical protein [Nostoc sp. C052]|nr:hypothetical protein [Nostoc sp. C052]